MADSPCMKNRSLKAGGRLNRWSLKAGFTVLFFSFSSCVTVVAKELFIWVNHRGTISAHAPLLEKCNPQPKVWTFYACVHRQVN